MSDSRTRFTSSPPYSPQCQINWHILTSSVPVTVISTTQLNRGVDTGITGNIHGVLHQQTLGVLMCTQTCCDCLHFVLERLTQHISCFGQCPPLCINVLPQLCKLLPLHLHGSPKIAHGCGMTELLLCHAIFELVTNACIAFNNKSMPMSSYALW